MANYDLGDHFVDRVAQTNRSVLRNKLQILTFRNKGDEGFIQVSYY